LHYTQPLCSFVWDLGVNSLERGANGAGKLLQITYDAVSATNCFVANDGNGNVSALVDAAAGTTVGLYEYGPFGELVRLTGSMANLNPFQYSTTYSDSESGCLYYGFRYYNPSLGRWLSRDPLSEPGNQLTTGRRSSVGTCPCSSAKSTCTACKNQFTFARNNGPNWVDSLGLDDTVQQIRFALQGDGAPTSCELFIVIQFSCTSPPKVIAATMTGGGCGDSFNIGFWSYKWAITVLSTPAITGAAKEVSNCCCRYNVRFNYTTLYSSTECIGLTLGNGFGFQKCKNNSEASNYNDSHTTKWTSQ
jgi:RHS repeat-associated protein